MVERDICCVDKFLTSLENNLLAKQQSGGSGEREKAMVKLIMEKDESKKRKGTAKKNIHNAHKNFNHRFSRPKFEPLRDISHYALSFICVVHINLLILLLLPSPLCAYTIHPSRAKSFK